MAILTAQDIIQYALKATGVLGVGQSAFQQDLNDSLDTMNMMIGIWNRKRWLIYHLVDTSCVSTGALSYTVGPSGQFDIPRTDRLEAAYFRQVVNPGNITVDYPLEILESREDYSRIKQKNLTSFARYVWFDSDWPSGAVFPWPVLQASIYELHIVTKAVISTFAALGTTINLPPEYFEAIWSNLALRLRTIYKIQPPQGTDDVKDLAKAALDTIRGANTQIPRLVMPMNLRQRGRIYNIYADY